MKRLEKIQRAIKDEIHILFQLILESEYGINAKVGRNTLADSRLHNTSKVEVKDFTFTLLYNDYLEFIESGRKPKARKVPIDALRDWARRKGLPTNNSVLYAIQQSIYIKGIPPRPLINPFTEEIDNQWNEWSEQLFNAITSVLDDIFNNN